MIDTSATGTARNGIAPGLTDMVERAFLLALFGYFIMRMLPSIEINPYNLLIILAEAFTAFLVLVRRPGAPVGDKRVWAAAAAGTALPLLILPAGPSIVPLGLGAALVGMGLVISLAAKMVLARSFGMVAANRGVKLDGPYRWVRHPMYLGYLVTHVGFLLTHLTLWNAAIYTVTWLAMALRIQAEEACLSLDPAYRAYCAKARWKLIPGWY